MTAPNPAPEIPNLLSFRSTGTRGRARGRGPRLRGGGRGGLAAAGDHASLMDVDGIPGSKVAQKEEDRLVQETDTDANGSRLSAVALTFLKDDFAYEFGAMKPGQMAPVIKQPIINRGTYVRTTAIDRLIRNVLHTLPDTQTLQIVSLGAGTDTRPFRFMQYDDGHRILYHELDFPSISARKYSQVRASKKIRSLGKAPKTEEIFDKMFEAVGPKPAILGGFDPEKRSWGFANEAGGYYFHPTDLREFGEKPDEWVGIGTLRTDCVTIVISECCLCYLKAEEADAALKVFTDRIPALGVVLYEPTKPKDAFGQMMSENLASRGLEMPSIKVYDSLEAQCSRLEKLGFNEYQEGASINFIWHNWIGQEETKRIGQLQMVDEEEEWNLLAEHYLICWASRMKEVETDSAFGGWSNMKGEVKRELTDFRRKEQLVRPIANGGL